MVITYSRLVINRVWLSILLVVNSTGKKKKNPLFLFAPENLVLRDRFGRPVPRQPRSFSKTKLNLMNLMLAPAFRDGVHLNRE